MMSREESEILEVEYGTYSDTARIIDKIYDSVGTCDQCANRGLVACCPMSYYCEDFEKGVDNTDDKGFCNKFERHH